MQEEVQQNSDPRATGCNTDASRQSWRASGAASSATMSPQQWGLMVVAGVGFTLAIVAALAVSSRLDVASTLRANSADQGFSITCRGVHLSASHGLVVSFDVFGDSELRSAHWHLWPLREVVVSK